MERLRVLVVGCGSIGKRHARLLSERTDVELFVCDALAENLQAAVEQAPGAQTMTDYNEALAAGMHAVFVCTPNHLHRPMCEQALAAGCDVFCEKPLADTTAHARAIAVAAQASERVLQVGYVLRLYPAMRRLREMAQEGFLGHLVGGRALAGSYFTLMCATTPYRLSEKNALIVDYTHQLDYMRMFLGDLEHVFANSATLGELPMMPQPNVFDISLQYRSGALAQIHLDYVQHPQRHVVELFGDRRVAVYDFETTELRVWDREEKGYHSEFFMTIRDDVFRQHHQEFLRAVRETRQPTICAEDGVAAMVAAEACVKSAETHECVRL